MTPTADRIGLPEPAADAGPEQGVDDDRRLLDALGEHRHVARDGRMDARDAWEPVEAVPVPAASGVAGRSSAATSATTTAMPQRGQPARSDEPVAAVVAGPARISDGPVPAGVPHGQGVGRRGHRGAGVLHQPLAGDPARLRLAVGPVIVSAEIGGPACRRRPSRWSSSRGRAHEAPGRRRAGARSRWARAGYRSPRRQAGSRASGPSVASRTSSRPSPASASTASRTACRS